MSGSSVFPTLSALTAGLALVLKADSARNGPVAVLGREPNPYASSYASEIVTCRCGAEELRLYCKYSAGGHGDTGYGLWGGVGYEAEVYRQVLSPAGAVTPRFYGTHTDAATGETWLVLQYLVESERIHRYPESLPQAARWLGLFHAGQEEQLTNSIVPFLRVYDAAFYSGWARRTALFARPLQARFPWLGIHRVAARPAPARHPRGVLPGEHPPAPGEGLPDRLGIRGGGRGRDRSGESDGALASCGRGLL